MTTRDDVEAWAARLRALADRVESAEHGEEVVEVADAAEVLGLEIRAHFPVAAGRV